MNRLALICGVLLASLGLQAGGQEIVNDMGRGKGYIRPTPQQRAVNHAEAFKRHGHRQAVASIGHPQRRALDRLIGR